LNEPICEEAKVAECSRPRIREISS
jgi:hypothetical protein